MSKSAERKIEVTIEDSENLWYFSAPLTIDKLADTFIVRNVKDSTIYKVFSLEPEITENVTFIHIVSADNKYVIQNDI